MNLGRDARIALVAISCTQLGCSFLFLHGPPSPGDESIQPLNRSVCNEHSRLPNADVTVGTIIAGVASAELLFSSMGTPPDNETAAHREDADRRVKIWVGSAFAVAAITIASAIWGFHTRDKCHDYIRKAAIPPSTPAVPSTVADP
jgi:hypothetical protein